MYTIGQFSIMTNTSKKALRYYDEINLMKPSKIEDNLYRYYDESKLEELESIKELKSFGLSLAEIYEVVKTKENDALNILLNEQLIKIDKELKVLDKRKELILNNLNNIKPMQDLLENFIVKKVELPSSPVIYIKDCSTIENIGQSVGKFYEYVNSHNIMIKNHPLVSISQKEDSDIFELEIFSYFMDSKQNHEVNSYVFPLTHCLQISCKRFVNREKAYKELFNYGEVNNISLGDKVIERYGIENGVMNIDIFVNIVEK